MSAPTPDFPTTGQVVYPGDVLATLSPTAIPGPGVYAIGTTLRSSLMGILEIISASCLESPTAAQNTPQNKPSSIDSESSSSPNNTITTSAYYYTVRSPQQPPILPAPGDIVLCIVTEIHEHQAVLTINSIQVRNSASLSSSPIPSSQFPLVCTPCRGVLRQRDVRSLDVDNVVIADSYRPGDVVRAVIVSLGDSRNYYLSTAARQLGVINAENIPNVPMTLLIPTDNYALLQYMKCPISGTIQPRKAALPLLQE